MYSTFLSSGSLTKSQSSANTQLTEFNEDLLEIDDKVASLQKRYTSQFGAMESAVTSLKSTGEYLDNMLKAWNDND